MTLIQYVSLSIVVQMLMVTVTSHAIHSCKQKCHNNFDECINTSYYEYSEVMMMVCYKAKIECDKTCPDGFETILKNIEVKNSKKENL